MHDWHAPGLEFKLCYLLMSPHPFSVQYGPGDPWHHRAQEAWPYQAWTLSGLHHRDKYHRVSGTRSSTGETFFPNEKHKTEVKNNIKTSLSFFAFVFLFRAYLEMLRVYSCLCIQESPLPVCRRPYGFWRMESGQATWKASALSAPLLLQPHPCPARGRL